MSRAARPRQAAGAVRQLAVAARRRALAAATIRFGQVAVVGDSVFWSESRPGEGGRKVVVECDRQGHAVDRNPAPFDARTRVHEYGGGAFAVAADGELFFCHDADQRVYRVRRRRAAAAGHRAAGSGASPISSSTPRAAA